MLTMLKNWKGSVEINGVTYTSIDEALCKFKPDGGEVHINLYPVAVQSTPTVTSSHPEQVEKQYRITVKKYMTQQANPDFNFMEKWNGNVPMPLRTMVGTIEKETRGMIYMKLHGDIYAERICTCMKCGRALTNPVSQFFGIGPECGGHNYVNPFNTKEELENAVAEYKGKLQAITWEGWVIKSAITEQEEVA